MLGVQPLFQPSSLTRNLKRQVMCSLNLCPESKKDDWRYTARLGRVEEVKGGEGDLQLLVCGDSAVVLDGGRSASQQGLEAEGQLYGIEAQGDDALQLGGKVYCNAGVALHGQSPLRLWGANLKRALVQNVSVLLP